MMWLHSRKIEKCGRIGKRFPLADMILIYFDRDVELNDRCGLRMIRGCSPSSSPLLKFKNKTSHLYTISWAARRGFCLPEYIEDAVSKTRFRSETNGNVRKSTTQLTLQIWVLIYVIYSPNYILLLLIFHWSGHRLFLCAPVTDGHNLLIVANYLFSFPLSPSLGMFWSKTFQISCGIFADSFLLYHFLPFVSAYRPQPQLTSSSCVCNNYKNSRMNIF